MSDRGSYQGREVDARRGDQADVSTPETAAESALRLAVPLIEEGVTRGSDRRFGRIDDIVEVGLSRFAERFLYALEVNTASSQTAIFGFRDAVTPNGRLWEQRKAFYRASDSTIAWLGVDKELLEWHRSPAAAGLRLSGADDDGSLARQVAQGVVQYGVPEWALRPEMLSDARDIVMQSLAVIADQYSIKGAVAPLADIYGVGRILKLQASVLLGPASGRRSDLAFEVGVRQWNSVAYAFGRSLGRQPAAPLELVRDWVDLVRDSAEIGFELTGAKRLHVMVADVDTETGLRLWNELDRAVVGDTATRSMMGEWFLDLEQARTVTGRPELTVTDFVVLRDVSRGLDRAVEILGRHLVADGRVSAEHYAYACRVMNHFYIGFLGSEAGRFSESERDSVVKVVEQFARLRPSRLSLLLARRGSLLVGSLRAALNLSTPELDSAILRRP